jgi:hypothetical protein
MTSNLQEKQTLTHRDIVAQLRAKTGALYVVDYPEGMDILHYPEAARVAERIANAVGETILLRMDEVEQFCAPESNWSNVYWRKIGGYLTLEELEFALTFSGAPAREPLYAMDCVSGLNIRIFGQRLANFSAKTGEKIQCDFNEHTLQSQDGVVEEKPVRGRSPIWPPQLGKPELL